MGIFSALRLVRAISTQTSSIPSTSPERGVVSPWATPGMLQTIVMADLFGTDAIPVSRSEAMSIPAVAKARHLVCNSLGRQPLRAYRGADALKEQPTWLYRTNTQTHPSIRMTWTLDDIFFSGWALWAVERGADGRITDAIRVPIEHWQFNALNQIEVLTDDGFQIAQRDEVILFSGPYEGLLTAAARTIRGARNLEEVWANRVRNPIPTMEIHHSVDEPLAPGEGQKVVDDYVQRRSDPNGAVVWTPYGIELKPHGDNGIDLFIQGRNAVTLDIARFTGVPAALLDASQVSASNNYSTELGKRDDFITYTLGMWATPVEARLSMDDVTPRGTRVAFDLSDIVTVADDGLTPAVED